jgi:putative hydrolase of HD superfamily
MPDLERYAYWLEPGHRWQELDGPYYPGPGPEKISEIIDGLRAKIEAGDWPTPRATLVIAEDAGDTLIGRVNWYWQSKETNWLSVGIAIYDPAYWRRGVGYQALGLWSDYLFRAIPAIVRLDLRTWSGNHGMMRLAEKLGYLEEARFRKARIVNGHYYDGLGYGVLREEWEWRYPGGFGLTR